MSTRIPIHVSNQTALVWDVDHVATLRSEHRICGVLSGTLPHLSQQNIFLGVPLVLVPEELVLLPHLHSLTLVTNAELATIVHDPAAHHPATPAQLESWDAQRQRGIAHQVREAGRRKDEDRAPAAMDAAAQQKRAERDARRQRQQLAEAAAAEDAGPGPAINTPAPAPALHCDRRPAGGRVHVSVPTTSAAFAWYAPAAHEYETLDAAREAGAWTKRARCEVFRDLWEKGYYLGGGSKFGGDWLVYPGDPLRYHSHFVATVQTSPTAPLRPMEIVAHGRLGTATKKAHLLCGWDPASREVTYISVEWAGFG
ncbi:tRNA-intron endonuclease catalytic domain-like protein [Lactarius deliciosus]|nr:tRNA-intron endonuclease catalytic domain-like protein [Lactarius deliciosus]